MVESDDVRLLWRWSLRGDRRSRMGHSMLEENCYVIFLKKLFNPDLSTPNPISYLTFYLDLSRFIRPGGRCLTPNTILCCHIQIQIWTIKLTLSPILTLSVSCKRFVSLRVWLGFCLLHAKVHFTVRSSGQEILSCTGGPIFNLSTSSLPGDDKRRR